MKIVILGMGSAAISIANIISNEYNYEVVGFVGTDEENKKYNGKKIYRNIPLIGTRKILKDLRKQKIGGFIAAIGDNYIREKVFYEASNEGLIPINAISRNAFIENDAIIKSGIVIGSGSVIQHGVEIGDNTFISSGCILNFKSKISENCFISPGCVMGSKTVIEKNVLIGSRSVINSKIKVGKNQIIESNQVINSNLKNLPRDK